MTYIYNIFKQYKYSLLLIYLYMFIAQMLFLIEPYVLGKMIDGLLHKEYFWIFCFIGIAIVENLFIYKRMVFDTKVYTKIYNNIVFKYLKKENYVNSSSTMARVEMSNDIINFLENDMHYYIYAIISIIGTLFFIFLENPMTGFTVLSCVAPICFIVYSLYRKIGQSTRLKHTHLEQKIDILSGGNVSKIDTFFKRRRKILIYSSTLQGKNWTALNITKTTFLILALIVFTGTGTNLTQGETVAMFAYINQFVISLMSIPMGVEIFTRMRDIINRIKE